MRLVFIAALLAACHRGNGGAPKLEAIDVRLRVLGPADLPVPPSSELQRMAEEAVAAVPGPMRYAATQDPASKLVVTIDLGWQPGSLRSQVRAQLTPRSDDAGVMQVVREALVEKEDAQKKPALPEVREHLARAMKITAGGVMAAEELWLGPPEAVRAALSGTDADLRLDAVSFAGERRDHEAVPALIALLKSEDMELRDRSLGALAQIGDARAVHPLAELAKFGDLEELPKIIDAVGRIGGPEAVAYLEFVVAGHPSPEVRDIATRALDHLKARTP